MTADCSNQASEAATAAPPHLVLLKLIQGAVGTQLICIAAVLGIPDLLRQGPLSSAEVAAALGAHAPSLHRIMRGLVLFGILAQDDDERFSLTALGQLLRSDAPGSLQKYAAGMQKVIYPAMQGLLHTAQTGGVAFDHIFGMNLFEFFFKNRAIGDEFDQTMTALTQGVAMSAVHVYDFSPIQRLVDIGGGNGTFISEILRAHPHMKGMLVDIPPVATNAARCMVLSGLADRCEIVPGDFFESIPSGGDAYLLSWVLHDWDNEKCTRVLDNCKVAMNGRGKLLIVEQLLPARVYDNPAAIMGDLEMLAMLPGRERSLDDYSRLLSTSGFKIANVIPVPAPTGDVLRSLIEAVPA